MNDKQIQPAEVTDEQIIRAVVSAGGCQYGEGGRYIDIEQGELLKAVRAILAHHGITAQAKKETP